MNLENTLSNLSLYDAKKYFRKAQNVVFSYTEMESKVREATNNEPWGAPSTLMEYIAQGTYNYKEREEIIGMVFRRFTEKTAMEWRQIYKALQLLEYIIKHGSERFIDDCRANISLISMLKDFHYIDSQGQDQGLNVRTRAKAIVGLLKDDNEIRKERKHARETAEKYRGIGNTASKKPNGVLNRGGGFNRTSTNGVSVSADFDDEEEGGFTKRDYTTYDSTSYGEYKEEVIDHPHKAADSTTKDNSLHESTGSAVPDLLGEDSPFEASVPANNVTGVTHENEDEDDDDDDEFSDFHAAPSSSTKTGNTQFNLSDNLSSIYEANKPSSTANGPLFSFSSNATPTSTAPRPKAGAFPEASTKPKTDDLFGSLLTAAKAAKPTPTPTPTAEKSNVPQPTTHADEDDDFGDLMGSSKPSHRSSTATPANNSFSNNSGNNGEIDLLSF
ncbi:hypothetical protein ACO0QE_001808 [Hanseniaspora vineae]